MGKIVRKAKEILFSPSHFFDRLKEKSIGKAFAYLACVGLFYIILYTILSIIIVGAIGELTGIWSFIYPAFYALGIWMIIVFGALTYGIMLAASFVGAAILHIWLLIWGVRSNYDKTYQLYVYGNSPNFILGWIPFLNWVLWIWSMIILIIGTIKVYNTNKTKAILIYVTPVIILTVLFIIGFILLLMVTNSVVNLTFPPAY